MIKDGEEIVNKWFQVVKRWEPGVVDKERFAWIRCFGAPCHVWDELFFKFLAQQLGEFVAMDVNLMQLKSMEVARLCVKSTCKSLLNRMIYVVIKGTSYAISIFEDFNGDAMPVEGGGFVGGADSSVEWSEDEADELFEVGKVDGMFDSNVSKVGGSFSCKSTSEAAETADSECVGVADTPFVSSDVR